VDRREYEQAQAHTTKCQYEQKLAYTTEGRCYTNECGCCQTRVRADKQGQRGWARERRGTAATTSPPNPLSHTMNDMHQLTCIPVSRGYMGDKSIRTHGFCMTLHETRYNVYLYPLQVWCLQVWVWVWLIVYPCQTLRIVQLYNIYYVYRMKFYYFVNQLSVWHGYNVKVTRLVEFEC
jgi:hypothetical protein